MKRPVLGVRDSPHMLVHFSYFQFFFYLSSLSGLCKSNGRTGFVSLVVSCVWLVSCMTLALQNFR
jgi:hypothetical protein